MGAVIRLIWQWKGHHARHGTQDNRPGGRWNERSGLPGRWFGMVSQPQREETRLIEIVFLDIDFRKL